MKEQKKSSNIYWIVGILVVLGGLALWSYRSSHAPVALVTDSTKLSGIQTGIAPWPPELTYLRTRLKEMGLPALTAEGTALHIHQHLDLYIDGTLVAVPSHIGINEPAGFISDIHTHDATGIIHVESPVVEDFTLGQFFDIWGVQFTSQSIGGYNAGNGKTIKVFVNGAPYAGDPRQLVLAKHQEIVVTYGTDQEVPTTIPSSYAFPAGL